MAYKPLKEDELPDSTDWLATPIPKLSHVDSALRCQVCREFYDTPMITSCSHTFCSLCIRRCLSNDGKCPACKANDQESKLRQNWAIGELVEAFGSARQQVLDFARRALIEVTSDGSGKRKRDNEGNAREDSPLKRTRVSGRTTRSTPQPIMIPDSDEDYAPEDEPDDGLVACPVCSGRMTVQAVEAHIDSCTGVPPTQKQSPQIPPTQNFMTSVPTTISKPVPKPQALPHPHYASLKDVQLRKKLSDQGLFAGGTRPQMEKRWSEFVIANNANCDAKNPKSKSELRRQMEIWEKTQGGIDREGAQIKDKNFDGLAWGAKHGNVFSDLAALARSKIPKKSLQETKPESEVLIDSEPEPRLRAPEPDIYTGPSASVINPYSSPYQGGTAYIQKEYHTDSANEPPISQPMEVYQNGITPPQQNLPTYSIPQNHVSQPGEDYGIPPSSQLQETPTRSQNHDTTYS